jgi:S-DNA-T family DNA segregation ATPase FtsK/SpoIIIE
MTRSKQDPEPGPLPPSGNGSPDPDARTIVDQRGGPAGPRLLDRVRGAKGRPVVTAWLRSRQEFRDAGRAWPRTPGTSAHITSPERSAPT